MITPGEYRCSDGRVFRIAGPHERWPDMLIAEGYDSVVAPGLVWWNTGIHPFGGPDLIDRIAPPDLSGGK